MVRLQFFIMAMHRRLKLVHLLSRLTLVPGACVAIYALAASPWQTAPLVLPGIAPFEVLTMHSRRSSTLLSTIFTLPLLVWGRGRVILVASCNGHPLLGKCAADLFALTPL